MNNSKIFEKSILIHTYWTAGQCPVDMIQHTIQFSRFFFLVKNSKRQPLRLIYPNIHISILKYDCDEYMSQIFVRINERGP